MKRLPFYLMLIALISSCSSSKKVPKTVTDRYESLIGYEEKSDASALVKIAIEVVPVPAPSKPPKPQKTLFDLTPKGQAAMEELTAKKDSKIDSALEALANKSFQDTKQDESIVDLTSQDRQITFDVSEEMGSLVSKTLSPADRIERLDIMVTMAGTASEEEKFDGWSQLTTKYGQYNIGGISFGRSSTATLNPSLTIGTVTASIGSLAKTDSFQQGDSLIQQFVSLSGHLSEKSFVLEMNSVPTTTLLGRTSLTVNMKARNIVPKYIYSFSNLFDDKAIAIKPEKVVVKSTIYLLPQLTENELGATLSCNYLIRHVDKGAETYFEGDDAVKYYYGHFSQEVTGLILKEDVLPKAWIILRGTDTNSLNNRSVAIRNIITGETSELTFIHYMDAINFLSWLRNLTQFPNNDHGFIRIGNYIIQIPDGRNFLLEPVPL